MVTCYLRYVIDPYKLAEFEKYGKMWIPLVNKLGGTHHGYFLPHEGANNIAIALFSFPNLAAYENYRMKMAQDPECKSFVVSIDRENPDRVIASEIYTSQEAVDAHNSSDLAKELLPVLMSLAAGPPTVYTGDVLED